MMKKMATHEEKVEIGESCHIPYGAAGAIPFRWEKEPGKPIMEYPYSDSKYNLPPLSPPPNRLFSYEYSSSPSSSSNSSSNFSYGHHRWVTTPRLITRKVIHILNRKFLRKTTSNLQPIAKPTPMILPKTRSLPSKLGLHLLKPNPKPKPKPSSESNKKNQEQELSEPNTHYYASSTNLSQALNPNRNSNSNSNSHELLSYPSSSSSSSSSSSYHSSSSRSCENVEVVPRRSRGGAAAAAAININDDESDRGFRSTRPYIASDMLTYSNPSSSLVNLKKSSRGFHYSGPINPFHYEINQGPSKSLVKDEQVKEKEKEEEEDEGRQTTFAEVVAASAQMFGPPDNYGSSTTPLLAACLANRIWEGLYTACGLLLMFSIAIMAYYIN